MIYVPDSLYAPGSLLFYVYVGALTGFTEVLLTWLLLRYTRLGRVPWSKVLAFGVGFGAFEALYQGIPNLVSSISAPAAPQSLSAAALSSFQMLNDPLYGLAPATDRFAATLVHICGNALLFYGVASRQARWMWVSFAFKSLVDTVAVYAMFLGIPSLPILWALEAVLLAFGFAAWWGIRQIRQHYDLTPMVVSAVQATPLMS